jgi:hypothetical protein
MFQGELHRFPCSTARRSAALTFGSDVAATLVGSEDGRAVQAGLNRVTPETGFACRDDSAKA